MHELAERAWLVGHSHGHYGMLLVVIEGRGSSCAWPNESFNFWVEGMGEEEEGKL
jgi:hypothetical protein